MRTMHLEPPPAPQPDATLSLQRLTLDDLQLCLDGVQLHVRQAVLAGVKLRMTGARIHGLRAARVQLLGPSVDIADVRALASASRQGGSWHLEPLEVLQGRLQAFITDAHWIVDADVTLPVDAGSIDFNRVSVSHIGPDSSMGISHLGIYVDAPNGRTYLYMFASGSVPGARFERRGGSLFGARVSDRGALALRPFVEALLSGLPPGRAPHAVEAQLDRTRLSGTLQPGDGRIGNERHHVVLSGRAGGMNHMDVSASVVGHEIAVRMARLSAAGAVLALPGLAARCGTITGAITATLRLPGATLKGHDLVIDDVAMGDPPPADDPVQPGG